MSLQKYVKQLRPRNESYVPHVDKVQSLLTEAYSFFPTSEEQITKELSDWPHESVVDVISLFNFLKGKDETPINIDLNKQKDINVSRTLKGTFDISDIKSKAKLKTVRIKFGNGSKGNRGVNNRGNAFETQFATSLEKWYAEGVDAVSDSEILDAILDLDKTYKLSDSKWLKVNVVGGENTKRPLDFKGKISITNTKGSGKDIGESVTDITLQKDDGSKIYLSLKFETTTTFFNVGVRTKLRQAEIDKGLIRDSDGKKLLELFGIDNKRFCTIFNDKVKTQGGKVTTRPNASAMKELLESGIGFGYHVIHKMRGKVLSKKMDESTMKAAAKVGTCTVHYGGKTGKGKRIDMEMSSPYYKFKLNIRDTQGKDGYPTRMMCDFTTLKV
tara:strand:+ start:1663 stop:2820 length:1158 start_codon:yes stop_codon:yes gene_type:complete